ncbi:U-scoloptoxin(01)-Cw1a-like isoform X2 [Paramacrobiotus metropolitanus]|nr:U-scoloptoxin(01)-Cw1a-like isoform X2 [Paramacrobiotus metropolitanus]XP_055338918.1 U-scoloptoxin(01)-Cw1a-like isoform X2 [Paramacrobiotus metropolitanus]
MDGIISGAQTVVANPEEVKKLLSSGMKGAPDSKSAEKSKNATSKAFCDNVKQPGLYADVNTNCRTYYRCTEDGYQTSYQCNNGTLFNQLTLVCDYFFNVACSRTPKLADFANIRHQLDGEKFASCYKECAKQNCQPKSNSL